MFLGVYHPRNVLGAVLASFLVNNTVVLLILDMMLQSNLEGKAAPNLFSDNGNEFRMLELVKAQKCLSSSLADARIPFIRCPKFHFGV